MKNRDEMIGHLTDEIVSGTLNHRRICLASVLDAVLDEPLLDSDDTANLISGDSETRLDILDRKTRHATDIVRSWLQSEPAAQTLIDEMMEKEREEAEADEEDAREFVVRGAA